MTTDPTSAAPVTVRPSRYGADGLISFSIYRAQSVDGESLNELLMLLAALSGGVSNVVQQHMPGARVEVGIHHESMVSHYVLGEVFERAALFQAAEISPSARMSVHLDSDDELDDLEPLTASPANQAPLDSAPDMHAQSALAKCCHAPAQSSRPASSLPEKSRP